MNKEDTIHEINSIIEGYTTKLTVRQVYYRLVAKHIIENKISAYQRTVRILRDARLDGSIDFNSIEDRTRSFMGGDIPYEDPDEFFDNWLASFEDCYEFYEYPRWKNQENYVEIWLEKQALAGVFEEVTGRNNLTLAPCRGYPSLTYLYEASRRLKYKTKEIKILYFGDFDPSGEDIYRNVKEMLTRLGVNAEFEKIAITQDQIEEYDIPPMPTKTTDPRSAKYIAERGSISSVELDAIEPDVLQGIIQNSIDHYFDEETYEIAQEEVEQHQKDIKTKIQEKLKE